MSIKVTNNENAGIEALSGFIITQSSATIGPEGEPTDLTGVLASETIDKLAAVAEKYGNQVTVSIEDVPASEGRPAKDAQGNPIMYPACKSLVPLLQMKKESLSPK